MLRGRRSRRSVSQRCTAHDRYGGSAGSRERGNDCAISGGLWGAGVVATRGTADPWSPKALRASAGSALRLPLLRGMAGPVLLAQLRMAGVKVVAAGTKPGDGMAAEGATDAAWRICEVRARFLSAMKERACRVKWNTLPMRWISIAMSEDVESLNAGVAASVILFEAARQTARRVNPHGTFSNDRTGARSRIASRASARGSHASAHAG